MYGWRMANDADQVRIWLLFRAAMDRRCPVRVSFFKRKKDARHKAVNDRFGNPVYVKVTRVVEPYELGTTKDGHHIVRVVDRTPEDGSTTPDYRMIRLDRVAVRNGVDGRPFVEPMWTHGFLCRSPLNGEELYPRKGAARGEAGGVLLTA